ncbi:putative glycosyltransferase EpsJ [Roseovarius litorisediminis]|uniref:Putative glycosyltransferase EpsJ n=1 Tax=Roseovarius litorisediminis TaxID=1312363 RepID=A0A1Y5SR42_9RHOB|nr:glycosyltransferase family 2 protein [Roseovarius litorisediminis]SLN46261.1 putative glycosyltransferase EpsJ [Roseovarius litorisediminis]
MSLPKVSVIVPVYNVADHVAACIMSVAEQNFTDFEVIVVNDGSTDGSDRIARKIAAGDPRFSFIDQPNGGLSKARNTGIDAARGAFVAFVDSDDRVAPDYLSELMTALHESGADWVSCAVGFCHPGAAPQPHSAVHGAPSVSPETPPERHDFSDWREVARHFPSAWNKLYRRSLIGDIRFDEDLLYEDHAFFWRCAEKTDHLLRLSKSLYLQTQGREGQITRDGSDRVFEQFTVLDSLADIVAVSGKSGGAQALAQIATRLSFERSTAITDPKRRVHFLNRARDWLAGCALTPDAALGVPASWISSLQGRIPVTIVIPSDGNPGPLCDTLTALSAQSLRETEILVVPDERRTTAGSDTYAAILAETRSRPNVAVVAGASGVPDARNRGLVAARGETVVFLDAGDKVPPQALMAWHNQLHLADADMGFSRFFMGGSNTPHEGLHDHTGIAPERRNSETGFEPDTGDALEIHAHPSAKIFKRDFLLRHAITFADHPLSSWGFLIAAVTQASRIVGLRGHPARIAVRPETRIFWRAPVEAAQLAAALESIAHTLPPDVLPEGWQARLWARAIWEKVNFADFQTQAARDAFEADAGEISGQIPGLAQTQSLDPFIGPRVRRILGL